MQDLAALAYRFDGVRAHLDERAMRLWAASEARAMGAGGVAAVAGATGLSAARIRRGLAELEEPGKLPKGRVRRAGAGRPKLVTQDTGLRQGLERLVDPATRGDPESPLRWTCKSTRQLAAALRKQGHEVSHVTVAKLLHEMGYSLQANRKTLEGSQHADRNEQFEHINQAVQLQLELGEPVISVDTKKKELIGQFKNGGREFQPKGKPEQVLVHDFIDPAKGRVSPYGVYDIKENAGWVNVGTDHDTAAFAVESIRRWWQQVGRERYPNGTRLLITADGGGSNGHRIRLWKAELQKLADETGLEVAVCHFPPGTSKWNKIEHRLFSAISQNWRGQPLTSHEVVLNLIAGTTTTKGLTVRSELDVNRYPTGRKVSDADMWQLNLRRETFRGEWNYSLLPRSPLLS